MISKMGRGDLTNIKKEVRAVLVSKVGGVKLSDFLNDYKRLLGHPLRYFPLGFKSLVDLLEAMPDVVTVSFTEIDQTYKLFAIGDPNTYRPSFVKKAEAKSVPVNAKWPEAEEVLTPNIKGLYAICFPKPDGRSFSLEQIHTQFSKPGEIVELNETVRFVFIRYKHKSEAVKAMSLFGDRYNVRYPDEKGGTREPVKGDRIKPTFSNSKRFNREENMIRGGSSSKKGGVCNLFVGNLPPEWTEEDIKDFFKGHIIMECRLVPSGRYAFIDVMENEADGILEVYNQTRIRNYTIIVQKAHNKSKKTEPNKEKDLQILQNMTGGTCKPTGQKAILKNLDYEKDSDEEMSVAKVDREEISVAKVDGESTKQSNSNTGDGMWDSKIHKSVSVSPPTLGQRLKSCSPERSKSQMSHPTSPTQSGQTTNGGREVFPRGQAEDRGHSGKRPLLPTPVRPPLPTPPLLPNPIRGMGYQHFNRMHGPLPPRPYLPHPMNSPRMPFQGNLPYNRLPMGMPYMHPLLNRPIFPPRPPGRVMMHPNHYGDGFRADHGEYYHDYQDYDEYDYNYHDYEVFDIGDEVDDSIAVIVTNFYYGTRTEVVLDMFSEFDEEAFVMMINDKPPRRSEARVYFKTLNNAKRAVNALDGQLWEGRILRVRIDEDTIIRDPEVLKEVVNKNSIQCTISTSEEKDSARRVHMQDKKAENSEPSQQQRNSSTVNEPPREPTRTKSDRNTQEEQASRNAHVQADMRKSTPKENIRSSSDESSSHVHSSQKSTSSSAYKALSNNTPESPTRDPALAAIPNELRFASRLRTQEECIPHVKLQRQWNLPDTVHFVVTHPVNNTFCWGHILTDDLSQITDLKSLMERMNEGELKPYDRKSHRSMRCAAPYEGEFYRAVIVDVDRTQETVIVQFIDYGNEAVVHMGELRSLSNDFWQLPAQAVPLKITGGDLKTYADEMTMVEAMVIQKSAVEKEGLVELYVTD